MQDFYVYILQCNDGSYYVGHTDNIYDRLEQHRINNGMNSYVSKRLPFKLVYVDCLPTRDDAREAERKFKGWSRIKKEILIKHGLEALVEFSQRMKREKEAKHAADPSTNSGNRQ